MSVEVQLKSLRTLTRQNSKVIINHIIQTNISRSIDKQKHANSDLCMFCGTTENITKEHVMPRWTYDHCDKRFFTTNTNGLNQTYNKATIPACSTCNNERLSSLEVYINKLFSSINLETNYFNIEEMENIIRWLEIIDYKFQILDIRRLFIASKEAGYIPYLADFPLSILRPNVSSPSKVVTEIRRSLKRVATKNKNINLNSLLVFKTSNKGFHFFHKMDDFVFIELPKHKLAIFYFYKRTFSDIKRAHKEAKKLIDKVY
jgi:hypothetical protein